MLLAIGGYSKLLTAEVASIPSVSPVTSCPSFDLPDARQSHVAFNTHDNKVKLISSDTKVILISSVRSSIRYELCTPTTFSIFIIVTWD